jgi:hypothetical protein
VSLQIITGGKAAGHMRAELPEPGFRLSVALGLIEMRVEDPDGIPIRGSCGHPLRRGPAIGATAGTTNRTRITARSTETRQPSRPVGGMSGRGAQEAAPVQQRSTVSKRLHRPPYSKGEDPPRNVRVMGVHRGM